MAACSSSSSAAPGMGACSSSSTSEDKYPVLTEDQEKCRQLAQKIIDELAIQIEDIREFNPGELPKTYVRAKTELNWVIGQGRSENDKTCNAVLSEISSGTELRLEALKALHPDEKIKMLLSLRRLFDSFEPRIKGPSLEERLPSQQTRLSPLAGKASRMLNGDPSRIQTIQKVRADVYSMLFSLTPVTNRLVEKTNRDIAKLTAGHNMNDEKLECLFNNINTLLEYHDISDLDKVMKVDNFMDVTVAALLEANTESSRKATQFLIKLQINPRNVAKGLSDLLHGAPISKKKTEKRLNKLDTLLNFFTVEQFEAEAESPGFLREVTQGLLDKKSPAGKRLLQMLIRPADVRTKFDAIANGERMDDRVLGHLLENFKMLLTHMSTEEFDEAIGTAGWFEATDIKLSEKTRSSKTITGEIVRASALFTQIRFAEMTLDRSSTPSPELTIDDIIDSGGDLTGSSSASSLGDSE